MANNLIYPFGENATGNNILTDANYQSDNQRLIGNQPGIARQELVNKALRNDSVVAAALAQFIADNQGTDVHDSLTPATLAGMLDAALDNALGVGAETISTMTTLTVSDAGLIEVDASAGPLTITLPAASSLAGINFQFSRIDSTRNIVTISAASGDSIEGSSTIGLYRSDRIALSSDGGTVWRYYTRRISQGTLPTGQDLNALTTAGLYETSQDVSSTSVVSITNGPVSYIPSGQLLVMQSGNDTMTQILADQDGHHLWFRSASFYNNIFSSWYDLKSAEKIGVNQSWTDVTSNRAQNTTYTNSTGKPILVNIEYSQTGTNQSSGNIYVNSVQVASGGQAGSSGGQTLSAIVPPGSTYHFSGGTNNPALWAELR